MKIIYLFIMFLILHTSIYANDTPFYIGKWGEEDKNLAISYVELKQDSTYKFVTIMAINHNSFNGKKTIFIEIYTTISNEPMCNSSDGDGPIIVYFNDQPIKMNLTCIWDIVHRRHFLRYTFRTSKGLNYVVNLFKQSSHVIDFQGRATTIGFSPTGFTKAWREFGSDAL